VTIEDERPIAIHVLTESITRRHLSMVAKEVATRLGATKAESTSTRQAARERISGSLTSREIEVLRLLAIGTDTDEIAAKLSLARNTVRNHAQNIMLKLGVRSRVEAVILALEAGLTLER
jgi:DNA-binding NarL/FixJ family response regulator